MVVAADHREKIYNINGATIKFFIPSINKKVLKCLVTIDVYDLEYKMSKGRQGEMEVQLNKCDRLLAAAYHNIAVDQVNGNDDFNWVEDHLEFKTITTKKLHKNGTRYEVTRQGEVGKTTQTGFQKTVKGLGRW